MPRARHPAYGGVLQSVQRRAQRLRTKGSRWASSGGARTRPRRHRTPQPDRCVGSATGALSKTILFIAIVFGTINIVGGFLVTDRMLGMFKGRQRKLPAGEEDAS